MPLPNWTRSPDSERPGAALYYLDLADGCSITVAEHRVDVWGWTMCDPEGYPLRLMTEFPSAVAAQEGAEKMLKVKVSE